MTRSNGGRLIVTNTTIRDLGGGGFSVMPASGSVNIQVLLNNVRGYHAGTGAQFGSGARAMIETRLSRQRRRRCTARSGAIVNVNRSVMSHNANGVQTTAGGAITLSNSDIAFNTTKGF